MNFNLTKKGITLIEVLVAISLFTVVAVVSTSILVQVAKVEKTSSIQNALYEDMRIVLQQITKEIQNGAIDYEEYHSVYVLQNEAADTVFGINYGVYGSRFYDPGESLNGGITSNPTDLGVECSYPPNIGAGDECEIVYTLSMDYNTGVNNAVPANNPTNSAFCFNEGGLCTLDNSAVTDYLFLIDNTGTKKTIIAKKLLVSESSGDYALGIVRLEGQDVDQNGVIDTFYCSDEFTCTGDDNSLDDIKNTSHLPLVGTNYENFYDIFKGVPKLSDLDTPFNIIDPANTQFVPISPLRSSIIDLKFIIHPLEDAYKAYGESEMQTHPSVQIILTMDLNEEQKKNYPGNFEPITIQTTVAAGVLGEIVSYPPTFEVRNKTGQSWIDSVPGI